MLFRKSVKHQEIKYFYFFSSLKACSNFFRSLKQNLRTSHQLRRQHIALVVSHVSTAHTAASGVSKWCAVARCAPCYATVHIYEKSIVLRYVFVTIFPYSHIKTSHVNLQTNYNRSHQEAQEFIFLPRIN